MAVVFVLRQDAAAWVKGLINLRKQFSAGRVAAENGASTISAIPVVGGNVNQTGDLRPIGFFHGAQTDIHHHHLL